MHTQVLIVATPGRGPRIECVGGVAARRTAPDAVHLVSTAATPLGGDTIDVRVIVEAGARLRVRSVAAMVVLPGATTTQSRSSWELEVAGELDLDPEPTVIAGGSSHQATTRLQIAEAGRVRLRERVQVGRAGEQHGFWEGSLHVDHETVPVVRHRVELGAGAVSDDEIAAPRAYVSEFSYPESDLGVIRTADGYESRRDQVVMALADRGCLSAWQGPRL
ncbi:urease accessory protein UreD [Mycolicibacterium mucogenicum]|uniref:Urease accessory protein n=1 Tax=Mycolicibacterium mucogenicum DSM 44124 TaxID=1226753 RepID=A0A8H2JJT5_MYCMU|nr:urease accessory protein UreD [Mycolicibacterium mucogenicum]QPG67031.1 urease accessory protein UreD [Mycolicibacterium mucogenicum DSM 44124]